MYVRVHVTPEARKEHITKRSVNEFDILVREPRAQNAANRRVQQLIAEAFQVEPRSVRLISGHRSTTKMYSVEVEG